jgi:hypothetical protein
MVVVKVHGEVVQFLNAISQSIQAVKQMGGDTSGGSGIGQSPEVSLRLTVGLTALFNIFGKHFHQFLIKGIGGQILNLLIEGINHPIQQGKNWLAHLLAPCAHGVKTAADCSLAGALFGQSPQTNAQIVTGAALRVAQNGIGMIDGYHLIVIIAILIAIGVVRLDQFAIRLLDLGRFSPVVDA